MKVLAFTDHHGSDVVLKKVSDKIKKNNVDLVICPGDFTVFGHDTKKIISKIAKLHPRIILTHGNHEYSDEVEKICKNFDNIIYLHKASIKVGDVTIFSYGGGGFAIRDPSFVRVSKKFLKGFKGGKLIFLTHGPPYGTKLDAIWGEHVGNRDYKDFIDKVKPMLYLCGHLHENFGVQYVSNGTFFMNPGPLGEIFVI